MALTIPLKGHSRLRLNTRGGKVTVHCEPRTDLLIERGAHRAEEVAVEGQQLTLTSTSASIELRCPEGTDLVLGTLSGSVKVTGRAGAVVASTASGAIEMGDVLSADLRSLSGSVQLGSCAGGCRLHTVSGRAFVARSGTADVGTMSGEIVVGSADGAVKAKTASGHVEIGARGHHDVDVHTISGTVTIRLPGGSRPSTHFKSLSGRLRSDCPEGDDCRVSIRTVSGKAEVMAL